MVFQDDGVLLKTKTMIRAQYSDPGSVSDDAIESVHPAKKPRENPKRTGP